MKNYVIVIALLLFGYGKAQEISPDLGNFNEVKVYNGLKVDLNHSSENKVSVTGNNKEEVKFQVENGILKIRTRLENIWKEDNTKIEVFYTKLSRIEAKQNSSVKVKDPIKQENLDIVVQEGADVFVEIDVDTLNTKALTGGEIEVFGKAKSQDVTIGAGGKFYAKNLHSKNIKINVNAGGVADVYATQHIDAKFRAGGTVNAYGNPKVIDQNTLFGGQVHRKN